MLAGRVLSAQLAPRSDPRRGVVVLSQQLARQGQPLEPAFTSVYIATLTHQAGRWLVASFTAQP